MASGAFLGAASRRLASIAASSATIGPILITPASGSNINTRCDAPNILKSGKEFDKGGPLATTIQKRVSRSRGGGLAHNYPEGDGQARIRDTHRCDV